MPVPELCSSSVLSPVLSLSVSLPSLFPVLSLSSAPDVYFDGTGITDAADNGKTDGEKEGYIPAGYAARTAAAEDEVILVKLPG